MDSDEINKREVLSSQHLLLVVDVRQAEEESPDRSRLGVGGIILQVQMTG